MPKIEITDETTLEDVKGRRQELALLMHVIGIDGGDFAKGISAFRNRDQVGLVIDAHRQGVFNIAPLFIYTSAGPRFPSALNMIKLIELAEAGELTIDHEQWIKVIKDLAIDDESKTRDGKKIKSEEEVFAACTGTRVTKKKKAPAKKAAAKKPAAKKTPPKKAPAKPAPEPEPAVEPEEEEIDESGDEPVGSIDLGPLMELMGGGFKALDERIMGRLDTIEEELRGEVRQGLEENREFVEGAVGSLFQAVQLLASATLTVYRRQEQLDILVDPDGEFPELDEATEEGLEQLIAYQLEELGEDEPEEAAEEETGSEEAGEDEPEVEEAAEEESNEEPEAEPAGDASDEETLTITADMAKLSDDEFGGLLESALEVVINDKKDVIALSLGKVRLLGEKVGVPGAMGLSHKGFLYNKIKAALEEG